MMQFSSHYGWGGMYGGGPLMMLIFAAVVIVPFWRILPKFNIPSWVAIFAIFPLVAIILLWVMAFRDQISGKGEQK